MQIAPSDGLEHLIRHFIIYHPSSGDSPMRFFSDGNPGIVIPLFNGVLPFLENTRSKKGAFIVYGLVEHYIDIPPPPSGGMMIVVLQPYTLGLVTAIPSKKLKNNVFTFSDVFRSHADYLQNAIREWDNIQDIIILIEDFFLKISANLPVMDSVMSKCLNQMHQYKGNIHINELLGHLSLTERNLERRFEHYIGIPPKKFTGILRINNFLKLLRSADTSLPPLQAAIEAGFYDQAHLNNNFKKRTGTTPLKYLGQSDPVAMNLFTPQV